MRYLLIFCLILPVALAATAEMPLLAVTDIAGNLSGSIAQMQVRVTNGQGSIFIDSFPLTKVETQMSTRFANMLACNLVGRDCGSYDFFYVIRADSSIIGGPSASAAAAVLTAAVLEGDDIKPNMSITGTISSGNIIGPVGGLKQKIRAANQNNVNTVLIPMGGRNLTEDNHTIDLVEYGRSLGVNVTEVATLDEVMLLFTGKDYSKDTGPLRVSESYTRIMKRLAGSLCNRTEKLKSERNILALVKEAGTNSSYGIAAKNLSAKGVDAFEKGRYYSSASFCFGANVQLQARMNEIKNLSEEKVMSEVGRIAGEINSFESELDGRVLRTITDLQAYMIVKERILEARTALNSTATDLQKNRSADYHLGYAEERLQSAVSWSHFFQNNGTVYDFGTDAIKESCIKKLSEADESYRYLQLYFPTLLGSARRDYQQAVLDYRNKDYALCLFRASKSKAHSSVLLGVLGRDEGSIDDLVDLKLDVAGEFLASQATEEQFPIVGYSYYEYADSLKDSDPYSSLLFIEYSLEMGNLELYFEDNENGFHLLIDRRLGVAFLLGFVLGVTFFYLSAVLLYRMGKSGGRKRDNKNPTKHS